MSVPALPGSAANAEGLHRSARLMQALGARGGPIWSELTPEEAGAIAAVMETLPPAEADEDADIAEAFLQDAPSSQMPAPMRSGGAAHLAAVPPENLGALLVGEHPQTIALIISKLSPNAAARALRSLTPSVSSDVLRRLLKLQPPHPSAVNAIERWLSDHALANGKQGRVRVARILDRMDESANVEMLSALDAAEPGAGEEVKALMFAFEDVPSLSAAGIQTLLASADRDTLALALKGAEAKLAHTFFANMTSRAGDYLRDEIEAMGAVRRSDVQAAQADIADIARELIAKGDIGPRHEIEDEFVD